MDTPSRKQLNAGLRVIFAITEAIREAKEVPAGTLYATLMPLVDLAGFDKAIAIAVGSGLVEKRGDLLLWVGPEFPKEEAHHGR